MSSNAKERIDIYIRKYMDIKILVAAHKKYWMPNKKIYMPIHVGKEGKEDIGYIGDNTGDNISMKNKNYCELTGLYWAWKNLDCEYIGLCHYRRYFSHKPKSNEIYYKHKAIFNYEDYSGLLEKYDIILPKKRNYCIETVKSQYEHAHNQKDLEETEKIIKEMYPEYSEAFEKVLARKKLHILNMFVMKKEKCDEYCEWLFKILFELEKRIDIEKYDDYQKRVYGFISERLFNVWLEKQELKAVEVKVINLEKVDWTKKIVGFLKRKFL